MLLQRDPDTAFSGALRGNPDGLAVAGRMRRRVAEERALGDDGDDHYDGDGNCRRREDAAPSVGSVSNLHAPPLSGSWHSAL